MKMERTMDAHEILRRPYARLVTPDSDGGFFAEIVEFPGCFATGKTAADALQNLESVAVDWINTAIAQNQNIPDPMESNEYSGKLVLRMPSGLHRRAALWAEREGVSLNYFITTCLAEAVGERSRPPVIYPLAEVRAVVTALIPAAPAMIATGTGVVNLNLGTGAPTKQLTTGTGSGLMRVMTGERDRERQYA
jgi:antitoxin HicB